MYGSDIDTLFLEGISTGGWQLIDTLIGQKQASKSDAWLKDTLNLGALTSSQPIQIRFRSRTSGPDGHIAVDNIRVVDTALTPPIISQIETLIAENSIKIYPNPTTDHLNLEAIDELLGVQYMIINLNGQVLRQGRVREIRSSIDVSNLENGMYFLIFDHPEVKRHKFIKFN